MSTFSALKKSSSSRTEFTKLMKKLEDTSAKKDYKDSRVWNVTRDKTGNGFAVIRFLPRSKDDELPFAKVWDHFFKGPTGQWYVENCPTTIGHECPVCKANNELWNTETKENQDVARKRKRRLKYIFNILVISDPANKENEGKVFLFEAGKKIFNKIMDKAKPSYEGEEPINVFDFWNGANFKLKVKNVEGYPNYDSSEWSEPSALFDGDDKKLEKLWESEYKLADFIEPSKFKDFKVLEDRYNKVVGGSTKPQTIEDDEEDKVVAPKTSKSVNAPKAPVIDDDEGESDDEISKLLASLGGDDDE